jgi:hypothetical protein
MRGVGELAELARDEVRRLLADVDRVVADPLDAAGDDEHPHAVLTRVRVAAEREDVLDGAAIRHVDRLVELDERLGPLEFPRGERVEGDAHHLFRPPAHLVDAGFQGLGADLEVVHELGQLGDGDAVVAHPLEVEVDAQHGEDEPEVGGDRRLARQERLGALLDREVAPVDLVVERDHGVGSLRVASGERLDGAPQRLEHPRALVLQLRLERGELLLQGQAHAPESRRVPAG